MLKLPPCPRCGYPAQDISVCTTCNRRACNETARAPLPKAPARGTAALVAGAMALPRGVLLLFEARGIKRLMLPPFAITCVIFGSLIAASKSALGTWLNTSLPDAPGQPMRLTSLDEGWWRSSLEWLLNDGFGIELLRGSSWLLFIVLVALFAWTCFAIIFELVAGPFLEEIHGILEERWFGADPRKLRNRPTDLPAKICAAYAWRLGAIGAAIFTIAFWNLNGIASLIAFPMFLAPFAIAAIPNGIPGLKHGQAFAKWIRWVLIDNSRTLGASLTVAVITLILVIIAFPLNFIPIVGSFIYAALVGMACAIGMLDLPLERRDYTVKQRLAFATRHSAPITLFGIVTGALFTIPIIGPMLAVPSASIGALWLVCRLAK